MDEDQCSNTLEVDAQDEASCREEGPRKTMKIQHIRLVLGTLAIAVGTLAHAASVVEVSVFKGQTASDYAYIKVKTP